MDHNISLHVSNLPCHQTLVEKKQMQKLVSVQMWMLTWGQQLKSFDFLNVLFQLRHYYYDMMPC